MTQASNTCGAAWQHMVVMSSLSRARPLRGLEVTPPRNPHPRGARGEARCPWCPVSTPVAVSHGGQPQSQAERLASSCVYCINVSRCESLILFIVMEPSAPHDDV